MLLPPVPILIFIPLSCQCLLHSSKPQFSPLTPFQTNDSLPPPIHGILDKHPQTSLITTQNYHIPISRSIYRQHETKNRQKNEKSPLVFSESSSSRIFNDTQPQFWKIPPGAKLIGYNMHMIAGYIPTVYLDRSLQKNSEERHKIGRSGKVQDYPSDDHNMIQKGSSNKMYSDTRVNNGRDIKSARVQDGEKIDHSKDPWTSDVDLSKRKITRFLKKREGTNNNINATIAEMAGLHNILWPPGITESEHEKGDEQTFSTRKMICNGFKNSTITSTGKNAEYSLSHTFNNPYRIAKNCMEIQDGQLTLATITPNTPEVTFATLHQTVLNIEFAKQLEENPVTLIPQVPHSFTISEQRTIFPQFQQQTKDINNSFTEPMMDILTKESLKPLVPSTFPGTLEQMNISKKFMSQSTASDTETTSDDIQKDHRFPDTIALIEKQLYDREKSSSSSSNSQADSLNNQQTLAATSPTMATTTFDVDSAEFADEDYEKAMRHIVATKKVNAPLKAVNPKISERRNTMEVHSPNGRSDGEESEEISKKKAKRISNPVWKLDNDKKKFRHQPTEAIRNEKNMHSEHFLRREPVQSNTDDNHGELRENFRDSDSDDDDSPTEQASEEGDGVRADTGIHFPEQIPSFQEWLSSLPVFPAFPSIVNMGVRNRNQPSKNDNPKPFLGKFVEQKVSGKGVEREQHSNDYLEEEQKELQDYGGTDSKATERPHQKNRFTLFRNVPYRF